MKTLATCTPREFLRQTNKIRKSVKNWLTLTQIMEIRKRMPNPAPDEDEETRKKALQEQAAANINAMLDAAMEDHPDETAELLGLLCFIEPDDLDNHSVSELLGGFAEMLQCTEVVDFFTSLMQLGTISTSGPAKR